MHIKLIDCGNIYLFAIPKLYGSLNNWVNIHHVWWCCELLITLQCYGDFINPQKVSIECFNKLLDFHTGLRLRQNDNKCLTIAIYPWGWFSVNVFTFMTIHQIVYNYELFRKLLFLLRDHILLLFFRLDFHENFPWITSH